MTEPALVRDVAATVRGQQAELIVDGVRHPITAATVDEVREAVFVEVTRIAVEQRRTVRFPIEENGTRWHLAVDPDGTRRTEYSEPIGRPQNRPIPNPPAPEPFEPEPFEPEPFEPEPNEPEPAAETSPADVRPQPPAAEPESPAPGAEPAAPSGPEHGFDPTVGQRHDGPVAPSSEPHDQQTPQPWTQQAPAPTPAAEGDVRYGAAARRPWPPQQPAAPVPPNQAAPYRAAGTVPGADSDRPPQPDEPQPRHAVSFLPPEQPVELPTAQAPQGFFSRILGRKNEPDPALLAAQRAEAADQALVSKHWPGPKTIAVVNGKGGSGKTPTTALLAAVFARYGGGGVIAWDNNDTRGTLGWRTASGGHDRTVLDLLPATEELMDRDAQVGRLAYYVHHQPEDKYDVLRSNPSLLAREQRLTTEQFLALHAVCNRFYRLIFMDSGNDESTYAWLNMIDAADQIVVPTTTRPDHAEAALLLLQALRNRNAEGRELAERAVVIVSQADQDEASASTIAAGFQQLLPPENVVTIPYDRAIRDSQLRYDRLNPVTQRAFLRAAAAVAGQL
ncbi:cellulose biosynthesis protein BcsQ [Friedmanniella endophytica]|uniref:Cellulose biosynthesis protein BcsQ n=1 Tax=Microlunatus kandeliicorticis TaxID=1759536 RepID=A0A7W3P562_9ACTN|nr:ParA family protein [Microlunatus kandeliicorticis]MBA8793634.1 cellulose biosynthesis protein BcsQ [Microlunatus kandeliicorticis]